MRIITSVLFGAATVFGASAASAATLINGSFEAQSPVVTGSFQTAGSGSSRLTGWSIGGGGVDIINGLWDHSDGNYSLDMSALSPGSVFQTVTDLVVSQTYTVTFDMASNSAGGSIIKQLTASFGGVSAGTFSFDRTGKSTTNMGWEEKSFTFTATGTSGELRFTSLENTAYGPALDNVRISAAPIPLPAGGVLLLSGFAGLALARRRRARS